MDRASSATTTRATFDDLMNHDGKAELIDGRIVPLMATGFRYSLIAGQIYRSLQDQSKLVGGSFVFTDNMSFAVSELSSGRESFSPDAAYFVGPPPADDRDFIAGPPTLAVEVRSKNDHGPAAERAVAAKRADYFEAGTLVVWDVDSEARVVRSYSADAPDAPDFFGSGRIAHAEPAVPGWRLAVDRIFG